MVLVVKRDQAATDGVAHEVGQRVKADFPHQVRPMTLDGARTQAQVRRNGAASATLGRQYEHGLFTLAELLVGVELRLRRGVGRRRQESARTAQDSRSAARQGHAGWPR